MELKPVREVAEAVFDEIFEIASERITYERATDRVAALIRADQLAVIERYDTILGMIDWAAIGADAEKVKPILTFCSGKVKEEMK